MPMESQATPGDGVSADMVVIWFAPIIMCNS